MSALYELMRRLDSLTADVKKEDENFDIPDVFDSELGDAVYSEQPQTSEKAVERIAKAVKSRSTASLSWNKRWTRMRNISQLLSNGMRMRADELGLKFAPDGYVVASDFIRAITKAVPSVGELTGLDLKKAILGAENVSDSETSGMGERHQFKTDKSILYVRCMQGHLTKYYGNESGLIHLDKIFSILDSVKHAFAYHDTKMGNVVSINRVGLMSNPNESCDGGRFVHLWVEGALKKGRKNQDVTYTIDVVAATKGGVKFYQAANGVVLVEQCVPCQFLTECKVHIRQTGLVNYAPFYDAHGNVDLLLLDFASDVLSGCEHDCRMKNLWHVLCPTIERRLNAIESRSRAKYDALVGKIDKKHNVVLNIKISYHDKSGIYLLMLNGKSDFDLVKLGKTYGFPRGCPILWKRGEFIDMRGFYPKFENDENCGDEVPAFNEALLGGATSLYFFKKWSGFLLHVIGFRIGDALYWTVCSKKSADPSSEFVIRGCDLMAAILDGDQGKTLLGKLADEHLYVGGEALHVDDEHGYVAKTNAVVVTCVGNGVFYNLKTSVRGKSVTQTTPMENAFMKYKNAAEVVAFCQEYGLLCDSSYTLTADAPYLTNAVHGLLLNRDLLRNGTFEKFIEEFNEKTHASIPFVTTEGGANHAKLVGDVLEGFVFHINSSDGNRHTVKVKLPFYTWRTMFLREWLGTILENGSTSVEGKQFVTVDCASRIEAFVRRWCFTADGKAVFRKLLKCAAVKLQTQWALILRGDLGWGGGTVSNRIHVIIADTVENLYFSDGGMAIIEKEADEFDALLDAVSVGVKSFPDDIDSCETVPVTLCLCVGPIGAGKSTFTERIYASNPSKFELIDGDMIVGRRGSSGKRAATELTLSLGNERNSTTLSRVWEAVMKGKVPLISHGGGSFVKFGRGSDKSVVCKLKDRVRQVFGVDTNLIVVLMRDSSAESDKTRNFIQTLDPSSFDNVIEKVYSDKDAAYMSKVYANRSDTGEWTVFTKDKDSEKKLYIDKFSKASVGNARYALAIAKVGSTVFTAPFQPGPADEWRASVGRSDGLDLVHQCLPANIRRPGFFQQLRLVMKEQNWVGGGDAAGAACRHMTLEYASPDAFQCNSDRISTLTEQLEGKEFTGVRYMMTLHAEDAIPVDVKGFSGVPYEDLTLNPKLREVDGYSVCKTVSVVHIPDLSSFCDEDGMIPHVTEGTDDLPAKDSINVIRYFQGLASGSGSSFSLTHRSGKSFVFDGLVGNRYLYEKIMGRGVAVGQRQVIVKGNYVNGTESVTFKCIGVAVFGNEDAN